MFLRVAALRYDLEWCSSITSSQRTFHGWDAGTGWLRSLPASSSRVTDFGEASRGTGAPFLFCGVFCWRVATHASLGPRHSYEAYLPTVPTQGATGSRSVLSIALHIRASSFARNVIRPPALGALVERSVERQAPSVLWGSGCARDIRSRIIARHFSLATMNPCPNSPLPTGAVNWSQALWAAARPSTASFIMIAPYPNNHPELRRIQQPRRESIA